MFADFNQYTERTLNIDAGINFNSKMGDGDDPSSVFSQMENIRYNEVHR